MQWRGISSQLSPMMPRPFPWIATVKMESIFLMSIWKNSFQSSLLHIYQPLTSFVLPVNLIPPAQSWRHVHLSMLLKNLKQQGCRQKGIVLSWLCWKLRLSFYSLPRSDQDMVEGRSCVPWHAITGMRSQFCCWTPRHFLLLWSVLTNSIYKGIYLFIIYMKAPCG